MEHVQIGSVDIKIKNNNLPLKSLPGCPQQLTDVINGKLYASQTIEAGQIVEVSRALIISRWETTGNEIDQYAWHSLYSGFHTDNVILLLGNGALYSAASGISLPSLTYRWYSLGTLVYSSHVPEEDHDHNCHETAFIAFVAVRKIEVSEALTIPLLIDNKSRKKIFRSDLLPSICF